MKERSKFFYLVHTAASTLLPRPAEMERPKRPISGAAAGNLPWCLPRMH